MKIVAITPNGKMDTLAIFIIDGLYDIGVDVIATDFGNNVKKVYTDDEIIEHSKDADYIFAFAGKHGYNGVPSPKFYLLDKINRPEITAYIDGSEYNWTSFPKINEPRINEKLYEKCKWYFKRAVHEDDLKRSKIIPCYIGARNSYFNNNDEFSNMKKEYDFYCSFGGNAGHVDTGLRQPVYSYCNELDNTGFFNSVVGKWLDSENYFEIIKKSYIGISAWGAENCCRRMWEILSNKTCCFVQKPFIIYPHKFVDGESCVYYETIDEFREKLDYYLQDKEECIRIGNNGYEHILKYHTSSKRVNYMLKVMEGKNWEKLYEN